jgi:hypothetical protein
MVKVVRERWFAHGPMFAALRESAGGPSRRWRSPELATGYWGSSAASIRATRGNLRPGLPRRQLPQDRGRGPSGRTEVAQAPSGGLGVVGLGDVNLMFSYR